MLAHFQELKAQMNKVREAERDKLTKITLESNAAIKEVKRQKEKVDFIEKRAQLITFNHNAHLGKYCQHLLLRWH